MSWPKTASKSRTAGLVLAVVGHVALGLPVSAAELVMLEQPGCPWCARFNEEIAPGYSKSEEGEQAPLRRVDITEPIPQDLQHLTIERFTPTFILMDDGREIDRLRGYPGDEFFYALIGEMLEALPPQIEEASDVRSNE
ncbi:transcriptional regulator [Pararhizobium haloflavum]|uniref:transcriptional regulator n=1 Tax=Pararhizobium haloflavum TaxID=2037914 RepID=UPI001FDFE2DF|nr:transcriptional regulator [Pararhizobium haloflavum]